MTHDSDKIHKEGEQKPQPLQINNPAFKKYCLEYFLWSRLVLELKLKRISKKNNIKYTIGCSTDCNVTYAIFHFYLEIQN